jgi:redox-sensitive bicupin YhaK (pirin superfamily)
MADTSSSRLELTESRSATVGVMAVRRALPTRARRSVGPWCFADHMGPASLREDQDAGIAPHPHIGLQTVTWLFAGEFLHRDSLGSEQLIRPGQLNLMSAGRGVVHSEESPHPHPEHLHGIQLWVAQPNDTRHGASAFEHHTNLPVNEYRHGTATVIVGEFDGAHSPARRDSDHVGVQLELRTGSTELALRAQYEYALIVAKGSLSVDATRVAPGQLGYLGTARDELRLEVHEPTTALLLGGVALSEPLLMWWNFVARSQEEITEAYESWSSGDERFGPVSSPLARVHVASPPWTRRP